MCYYNILKRNDDMMFGFALAWKWKEGEKNHHLTTNSQMQAITNA
jgi:hypothetical protein